MPHTQVVTRINGAWVSLFAVVLVTVLLWAAKDVLLPLALGIILAFMLSPLVRLFDKAKLPRFASVTLTMMLALGSVGGAGYVIADQFADLATQVTRYTSQMRQKATELRAGSNAAFKQFTRTVDRVTEQLDGHASELRAAQPVRVVASGLSPVERLREKAAAIFEPLASAVIVLVLVAFMLGQREDLRDRLIRLTGTDNVIVTTRLLDEAAQRVSRYLVAQTLVNICLGALVAAGLYWIGVPYAALWGGLTAVLRFVPYVGTTLSALLPAALAFAIFPGWTETLQTLGMFLILDLTTGYFIEPLLFGRRTGVSSFALLVSALFWIWVWGPMGLLLATPLTVCIAVLGRHVKSLRFLAVLFADEPALQPHVGYYQRLLARDEDEANALASRMAAELGAVGVMDEVLIPALRLAEQHYSRSEISQEDMDFVVEATAEIVVQIRARQQKPSPGETGILLVGTSGCADKVVLEMLATAMEGNGHAVTTVGENETAAEAVTRVVTSRPDLTCVVAVSSTRGAQARGHCRRIRSALPSARLLVLRPLPDMNDTARSIGRMKEAGADRVAITLRQAIEQAAQLLDRAAHRRRSNEREVDVAAHPQTSNA
ncbi:AI-2E family transporter [Povalibacter sp.]|uniref:AI-2E family transporter n=1 Tax=Povalibacter sp. TaxID=1962978 RepID=UPI002F41A4D6